jgi:haloalkane dehalogenase
MLQHSVIPSARRLPNNVREHYPWQGKHLELEDGVRLHYLDEGEGEPLLMLHGNPTWSFYYRNLVRAFSTSHRCVVPDHVGCGLSDKPSDWAYRLENHSRSIEQLIERLDLRDITLVVHDWGGAIGFAATLKHRARIKRLVLCNTSVFQGHVPLRIRLCRWPLSSLPVRGLNAFLETMLMLFVPRKAGDGVRAGYRAPYGSWADRVAIHRFVQDIPIEAGHPTRGLIDALDRATLEFRNLPTLIVWGARDFVFTDEFLSGWKTRLPQAEVHRLGHAGHLVAEDAPDEVIALMRDFIRRNPIGASAWK